MPKTAVVILIAVIIMFSSWTFVHYNKERKYLLNVSNSSLYDLYDDLDLLISLRAEIKNKEILKASENIVLKKILIVSKIKPEVSMLQGIPLRALCRALELNYRGGLFEYADKDLVALVEEYMNSITETAKEEMKSYHAAKVGEDCAF